MHTDRPQSFFELLNVWPSGDAFHRALLAKLNAEWQAFNTLTDQKYQGSAQMFVASNLENALSIPGYQGSKEMNILDWDLVIADLPDNMRYTRQELEGHKLETLKTAFMFGVGSFIGGDLYRRHLPRVGSKFKKLNGSNARVVSARPWFPSTFTAKKELNKQGIPFFPSTEKHRHIDLGFTAEADVEGITVKSIEDHLHPYKPRAGIALLELSLGPLMATAVKEYERLGLGPDKLHPILIATTPLITPNRFGPGEILKAQISGDQVNALTPFLER